MNDPGAPNPNPAPIPSFAAEWLQLYRSVAGLIDADLLLAAEGAALLAEIATARRAWEGGEAESARRYTSDFVLMLEALVRDVLLDEADARPARAAAQRLLEGFAG
jgi:hypothetical protein